MTTEPTTADQPHADPAMSRADRAEQIAFYRAVAAEAKKKADQYEAGFESAIGDEYRREKTAPTWRVKGLVTISGRTKNSGYRVSDASDFLAWVKAHRPAEVETIEQVRDTFRTAVLKGCTVNGDGLIVTKDGDELAGVEYVPGGAFQGVSFAFETSAKEAYSELARTSLERLALKPAVPEKAVAAAPFEQAEPVDSNPWDSKPADPWDAPAPSNPWTSARSGVA